MFSIRKPSPSQLARLIAEQRPLAVTFSGDALGPPPPGFDSHRVQRRLGEGPETFARARTALQRGAHFQTAWTTFYADEPIAVGTVLVMLARAWGLWSANACRVLQMDDEPQRYGFAFGTLPRHIECGRERFAVARRPDGSVWYEVDAVFRPCHRLIRLGWPIAGRRVNRFRRDSADALQRAIDAR